MNGQKATQIKGYVRTESTSSVRRSLRRGEHQTPKLHQYIQSVKRGRGRPRKTHTQTNATVGSTNQMETFNDINERNVVENNGLTISLDNPNETPPQLIRQTMDMGQYINTGGVGPQLNHSAVFPNMSQIYSLNVNEGQLCSDYLKACEKLTDDIEKDAELKDENLMTALKYVVVKCNLGSVRNSIDAIKLAIKDMSRGVSWNIDNRTKQRDKQAKSSVNHRPKWHGHIYTPNPNYN